MFALACQHHHIAVAEAVRAGVVAHRHAGGHQRLDARGDLLGLADGAGFFARLTFLFQRIAQSGFGFDLVITADQRCDFNAPPILSARRAVGFETDGLPAQICKKGIDEINHGRCRAAGFGLRL